MAIHTHNASTKFAERATHRNPRFPHRQHRLRHRFLRPDWPARNCRRRASRFSHPDRPGACNQTIWKRVWACKDQRFGTPIIEQIRHSPTVQLIALEFRIHIQTQMHVAPIEIDVVEIRTQLDESESRRTDANGSRISAGHASFVQHRIVHHHFHLEGELLRNVGDVHAALRTKCGQQKTGTAGAHAVHTVAGHATD